MRKYLKLNPRFVAFLKSSRQERRKFFKFFKTELPVCLKLGMHHPPPPAALRPRLAFEAIYFCNSNFSIFTSRYCV